MLNLTVYVFLNRISIISYKKITINRIDQNLPKLDCVPIFTVSTENLLYM